MPERQPIRVVHEKRASIPDRDLRPHYTDKRVTEVRSGVTIFLANGYELVDGKVPDATYTTASGWALESNRDENRRAEEAVGSRNSAAYYEALLRGRYHNPNLDVVHLVASIDTGTLFSDLRFGMIDSVSGEPIRNPNVNRRE